MGGLNKGDLYSQKSLHDRLPHLASKVCELESFCRSRFVLVVSFFLPYQISKCLSRL